MTTGTILGLRSDTYFGIMPMLEIGQCIRCRQYFPDNILRVDPIARDPHYLCCEDCKNSLPVEIPQKRKYHYGQIDLSPTEDFWDTEYKILFS